MNNLLDDTLGIDTAIQNAQIKLYDTLSIRWAGKEIDGYGRIHNMDDVPKWFNITTLDYEDVYLNDKVDANFSFITSSTSDTEDGYVFNNDTKIVVTVNLETIFDDGTGRQDERVHRDLLEALRTMKRAGVISEIESVETGIENVFRGFNQDMIKFDDLQPFHVFCINVTLAYSLKDKC